VSRFGYNIYQRGRLIEMSAGRGIRKNFEKESVMDKSIFAALVIAVLVAFPIGCGQQEASTPTAPQEEVVAPEGTEAKPMEGTEAMPMEGTEAKPMEGTEAMPMEGSEMKPMEGSEAMPMEGSEMKPMEGSETKPMEGSETMVPEGSESK